MFAGMLRLRLTVIYVLSMVATSMASEQNVADSTLSVGRRHPAVTGARAVADRATWVKRRRQFTARGVPYGVTGIPIGFVSNDRQWTVGGRAHLVDLQQIPFRYKVMLGWMRDPGTGNRYNLRVLVPRWRGSDLGLLLNADTGRSHGHFFGFGNSTSVDRLSPSSEYLMNRSNVGLQIRRWLSREIWLAVGGSWREEKISDGSEPGLVSLLLPQHLGVTRSNSLSIALSWDTRDDPSLPRRGTLHSWSVELVASDLTGGFGSERARRWTVVDRRYVPVGLRFRLLTRHLFEIVDGELPVDAYGELGDPGRRLRGVGGDGSIRGLQRNRFQDDIRLLAGYELHRSLASIFVAGQFIQWRVIAFLDAGRVYHRMSQLTLTDFHVGTGGGIHLVWDEDFVIRIEAARSGRQQATFVRLSRSY